MTKGIVTLCGSTKFKEQFNDANFWLTMNGHIVLSVGSFLHSDNDPAIKSVIEAHKKQLDVLHKAKIAMSKSIMVIDVDGYVGESTSSEVAFAFRRGIPIYSYEDSKKLSKKLSYMTLASPDKVQSWVKKHSARLFAERLEIKDAKRHARYEQ